MPRAIPSSSRSSRICSCRSRRRWASRSAARASRRTSRSGSTTRAPSTTRAATRSRRAITCRCTSARCRCRCARRSSAAPWSRGDVVVLNDPFRGGTHLPDITLVSPVTSARGRAAGVLRRQPRASLRRRRHEPGLDAASRARSSRKGSSSRRCKLVRRGEIVADVLDLILANVRTPDEREGDITAQIAANRVGRAAAARDRRASTARGADAGVRAPRCRTTPSASCARRFARFPTATTPSRTRSTTTGSRDAPVPIRVRDPHRAATRATVDFTGSASAGRRQRQRELRDHAVGAASTRSAASSTTTCSTTPAWRGRSRVIAPEGTDRQRAAAGRGGRRQRRDVAADHGRRARRARPRAARSPARGEPGHDEQRHARRTRPGARASGSPTTRRSAAAWAAAQRLDGLSGVHTHMSNTRNTPVEAIEHYLPVRITPLSPAARQRRRGRVPRRRRHRARVRGADRDAR